MAAFGARLLKLLANSAGPAATAYADHHAAQAPPAPRKRKLKGGCTPCAAMAAVEKARKTAGTTGSWE